MINYAHRGASERCPENTLWAFYAALEMGANGIETDIQRTKDGVLVLFHDNTLARVTGDARSVLDCTYDQLCAMDFGRFKGDKFAGERIVTLETFLRHFGRRGLALALEIKQPGIAQDILAQVDATRSRTGMTITSFHWDSLLALRQIDADIPCGLLTDEPITHALLDRLEAPNIRQVCPKIANATAEQVDLAQKRGFSIRYWGVQNEVLMRKALALGGDGMTVDFPDRLALALHGA
jgi:Glycerophosphoryl diester phosphodiesterase